jgi:hypothetical protein
MSYELLLISYDFFRDLVDFLIIYYDKFKVGSTLSWELSKYCKWTLES